MNILAPFCESEDNRKEFAIVNIIVSFSGEKSTGEVGAGMEIAVGICLEKDSAHGEQGGVSHDGEQPGDIRDRKYWSRREGGLEGIKRALLEVGPGPWLVLSCE